MVRHAILLTLDALGAGHVGHRGYERDTTPNLDALADDGLEFGACIAQSSHTRESMPSLFASAYPSQFGGVGAIPTDRPTLPEVLSNAGFATAGFHSNPYLSRAYDFDLGFDEFDDSLPLASNRLTTFAHRVINHFQDQPYTRAEAINEAGLSWLDGTEADRRFLWLHYMDPHGPYQPPEEYQRRFRDEVVERKRAKRLWRRTVDEPETITAEERKVLWDLYDGEIRYADAMIGQFLDEIESRGLLDDSILVVGADHGDAFGEHGYYGHPRRVYEELVHVPLVIQTPDDRNESIDRPVENLDVAPTIVDAVESFQPTPFEGRSLLARPPNGPDRSTDNEADDTVPAFAVAEATGEGDDEGRRWTAIRTPTKKLHVVADVASGDVLKTEFYDLSSDPSESKPIDDEATHERLCEIYRSHRIRVRDSGTGDDGTNDDVDSVVEDRLQDLGYR